MSLTSILRSKDRGNVKDWFKYHFPNPGLGEKPDIIVPPLQADSVYSSEIGTAFDYLVRFNLERINKETNRSKKNNWIAYDGLASILRELFGKETEEKMFIGYHKDIVVDRIKFGKFLVNEINKAKKNYEKFIKKGDLTEELIKSSIFLAKLDEKYRSGIILSNFDKIEADQINELKQLFSIMPWENFKANNHCILNPTFGKGSSLVGGADADLIIDNTLIDLKATKNFTLERIDLNQIIGYYLLSLIGGINGKRSPKIKEIGIYYARYKYLWKMPLSKLYDLKEYKIFADEFTQLVNDPTLELVEPTARQTMKSDLPNLQEILKKLDLLE